MSAEDKTTPPPSRSELEKKVREITDRLRVDSNSFDITGVDEAEKNLVDLIQDSIRESLERVKSGYRDEWRAHQVNMGNVEPGREPYTIFHNLIQEELDTLGGDKK